MSLIRSTLQREAGTLLNSPVSTSLTSRAAQPRCHVQVRAGTVSLECWGQCIIAFVACATMDLCAAYLGNSPIFHEHVLCFVMHLYPVRSFDSRERTALDSIRSWPSASQPCMPTAAAVLLCVCDIPAGAQQNFCFFHFSRLFHPSVFLHLLSFSLAAREGTCSCLGLALSCHACTALRCPALSCLALPRGACRALAFPSSL